MKNNQNVSTIKGVAIVVSAVLAVILIVALAINSVHSSAIKYEENVTEAQSRIKVREKERADKWPNLADCAKEYDKHEAEIISNIAKSRETSDGILTDDAVMEIQEQIKIVLENYPELKSQNNYQTLMYDISITEEDIASAREAYNKMVSRYNEYTRPPLTKFFLNLTGYEIITFEKLDYNVSEDAPTNLFD